MVLIMATPLWFVSGNGLFLALVLPDYHPLKFLRFFFEMSIDFPYFGFFIKMPGGSHP